MTVKHFTASALTLLLLFATTAGAQQAPTTTTTQTTQTTQTQTPAPTVYAAPTPSFDMYHNVVTGSLGGAWSGAIDSGSFQWDAQYRLPARWTRLRVHLVVHVRRQPDRVRRSRDQSAPPQRQPHSQLTESEQLHVQPRHGAPDGTERNLDAVHLGGIGWFHISGGRVDFDLLGSELDLDLLDPDLVPEFDSDGLVKNFFKDDQFGGNLGLGVFGFFDQVGLRADVRYYSGLGNTNSNLGFISQNIENIHFWRGTAGVSYRWYPVEAAGTWPAASPLLVFFLPRSIFSFLDPFLL